MISLGRRRSSITSWSRFEINEPYRCDADVLRCSITKLIFGPAIYNAVKDLTGVDSYKTTKAEHAKSMDTIAWVSRLSESLHETHFQWFSFHNSSWNLVLYASLEMVACGIEKISTRRQQRGEIFGFPFGEISIQKSSKMSAIEIKYVKNFPV